jgi:hypothetical protein
MALKPLPADDTELLTAATTVLPSCPFCGDHVVMMSSINETPAYRSSPIFQSKIACMCGASFSRNAESREQAQRECVEGWSRRTTTN